MIRVIRTNDKSGRAILNVQGELVSEWVPLLEKECQRALTDSRGVVLDLSGITFVGPHGARTLRKLRSQHHVRIVNASKLIEESLNEAPDEDLGGGTQAPELSGRTCQQRKVRRC